MKKLLILLFLASLPVNYLSADVVKPALVEINIDKGRSVNIEVRASIEALLTGINAQYKNTQDAPNAEEYDDFRKMSSDELQLAFEPFRQKFLKSVFFTLTFNTYKAIGYVIYRFWRQIVMRCYNQLIIMPLRIES